MSGRSSLTQARDGIPIKRTIVRDDDDDDDILYSHPIEPPPPRRKYFFEIREERIERERSAKRERILRERAALKKKMEDEKRIREEAERRKREPEPVLEIIEEEGEIYVKQMPPRFALTLSFSDKKRALSNPTIDEEFNENDYEWDDSAYYPEDEEDDDVYQSQVDNYPTQSRSEDFSISSSDDESAYDQEDGVNEEKFVRDLRRSLGGGVRHRPLKSSSVGLRSECGGGGKGKHRRFSYEILEKDTLLIEARKMIDETKDVLGIQDAAIVSLLLRIYKWNQERLVSAYVEDGEKVLQDAGLSSVELEELPRDPHEEIECPICYDDVIGDETYALSCGHRFCKLCWRDNLETLLKTEGSRAIYTHCMYRGCSIPVHEDAFRQLVSPEMYEKYQYWLVRSFVDDNSRIKWCPAVDCQYAISSDRAKRAEPVQCTCGFIYCFTCSDLTIGDHHPATCEQVEMWLEKEFNESETVNWLKANTKKCPGCGTPIEKNEGCMHMTCTKAGCGYEFCWLCRGPWSEHGSHTGGYYECNKYDSSNAKKEDMKAEEARKVLEHYLFYYHRYLAHRQAFDIADEQLRKCNEKREQLREKFDVPVAHTHFLEKAVLQLVQNRRVLRWSYAYGYYVSCAEDGGSAWSEAEKNLFEFLQAAVEANTNTLSELYEKSLDDIDDFARWKESIVNQTRISRRFLINFVDGVNDGLIMVLPELKVSKLSASKRGAWVV